GIDDDLEGAASRERVRDALETHGRPGAFDGEPAGLTAAVSHFGPGSLGHAPFGVEDENAAVRDAVAPRAPGGVALELIPREGDDEEAEVERGTEEHERARIGSTAGHRPD